MDAQEFIRLTDTYALYDLWFQPVRVEPQSGEKKRKDGVLYVYMRQIILAPHIKSRFVLTKMSADDLLRVLFLNDKLMAHLVQGKQLDFDEWMRDKSSRCVKVKGVDEGTNRGVLCNFIMCEDPDFSFYPRPFRSTTGVFFRKICYHSYKCEETDKMDNPAMMKCAANKSKFEYVLEVKLVPLPAEWPVNTKNVKKIDVEELADEEVEEDEESLPPTLPLF